MEPMSIINDIQIPPGLTKETNVHDWTAANDIILCVLETARKEVEVIAKEDGTSAEDAINFIKEVNIPYVTLPRHLLEALPTKS